MGCSTVIMCLLHNELLNDPGRYGELQSKSRLAIASLQHYLALWSARGDGTRPAYWATARRDVATPQLRVFELPYTKTVSTGLPRFRRLA